MTGAASFQLHLGDTREWLPTLDRHSVHCVITSPPYYLLRDYGFDFQMGLGAEGNPAYHAVAIEGLKAAHLGLSRAELKANQLSLFGAVS